MKNRTKYLILALCLPFTVFFGSCDSFLDKQEDEALQFDKIWETYENSKKYWGTTMGYIRDEAADWRQNPWMGASDEASITYAVDAYRLINFGSWNPSNVPWEHMADNYRAIRECNVFLQNIDKCQDYLLTHNERGMWKVQTRFARAYYYFQMMRIYGPIFLMGDELMDFAASTEALQRTRSTWDECMEYVVGEFDACAKDPYMKKVWATESEYGLATQAVCQAFIARLQLYSARDLFNGNKLYASVKNPDGTILFPQDYNANKWKLAADAAKLLVDNTNFALYRSLDNDPYANYYGVTQVLWNKEIIWSKYSDRKNMSIHTAPTALPGTAWGGVGPTQQQVDAYAMSNGRYPISGYQKDGSPIIDETSGYPVDEMAQQNITYPAWGGGSSYSMKTAKMFADREPRFYVSVAFSGCRWYYGSSYKVVAFGKGNNSNISQDYPKSGYLVNRMYDHTLDSSTGNWGNCTFPTIRLAEMYLNFIEATLECKKRGVTTSYEAQAMKVWDDLRDRAGLKGIMTTYPGVTTDQLIELCRQERRIELAFENQRYFDTRTWMIAEDTDGGQMWGLNVTAIGTGDVTPAAFWKRYSFETRVFKKNHYLYPFSQYELDRNKILSQNYGW